MQPHEIRKIFNAYKSRQKDKDMRTSYFVSWLVSPHLKKPVSANEIYKPLWENAEDKKKQAKEDKKILLDEFADILDADKHFNPDKYGA